MITYARCFFLILTLFFAIHNVNASYHKTLWPLWEVNNPLSTEKIDHDEWQQFLSKRVLRNDENINLIDYAHLDDDDFSLLKKYIEKMTKIDISNYNRQEQLAFWINVYNALTVQIVADYYPIGSIEEIKVSPGIFSIGPWGKKIITINDTPLTLDDIQNRILRPIWNDPRILYALNNASIGAPNIRMQAYQGSTIHNALNEAAFEYINSLRGAQVIEGALIVSKIYDWYIEDFGGATQDVITHLKQFAMEPLRSQLKHVNNIDSYIYNWHLNCFISTET